MENEELQAEIKGMFDSLAQRLDLGEAIFLPKHMGGFSFSYPGRVYGLEIDVELFSFFVMPLVYICDQQRKGAPAGYRDDHGRWHKDYLGSVSKRTGLNLDSDLKKLASMRGNVHKCRKLCADLVLIVERSWPEIAKCPTTQLFPENKK